MPLCFTGTIDAKELGALARSQGHKCTDKQMKEVIEKMSQEGDLAVAREAHGDDDNSTLSFEEFVVIMKNLQDADGDGMFSFSEIADHLLGESLLTMGAALYETMDQTGWRFKLAVALDNTRAQIITVFLVVADVMATAIELSLVATKCSPQGAAQKSWDSTLHIISMTILYSFLVQLIGLNIAYGWKFWHGFSYVFDTVIVVTACALETAHSPTGPIFIIMLFWRMVRIFHGIAVSVEKHVHLTHEKVHKKEADNAGEHAKHEQHLAKISDLCVVLGKDQADIETILAECSNPDPRALEQAELDKLAEDFTHMKAKRAEILEQLADLRGTIAAKAVVHDAHH
jgi:hypothetical protein